MKTNRLLFLILLFSNCHFLVGENVDSLLNVLDKSIEGHQEYVSQKENYIRKLKETAAKIPAISPERYELNMQIYKEYKAFICDSAIQYLNENIFLAGQLQDMKREMDAKLLLSRQLSSSGMYKEAVDILETVERQKVDKSQLLDYYSAFNHIYSEIAVYTQDKYSLSRYWDISGIYKDSLSALLEPQSEQYLVLKESSYRDAGQFDEAFKINDIRLNEAAFGTPQYALVTYYRSLIYQFQRDAENEKYYLILSAISDIQSANKDHASLWMLAQLLYEEGDVERAYRYMRFSWNETKSYNARLRSWQSAGILSMIDKTYQAMSEKQNRALQIYLVLISALTLLLVAATIYIYRQMKRLSVARNHLQTANGKLKTLNEELQQMNVNLQSANLELSESNQIKEEYIARFVKLCSTYIDKLDAYRRMVNRKISSGQTEELFRITRSQKALDDELKELYDNFDTAFLHLFPDFVGKFNALLQEDGRIVLKKGELLNTELRIFALIRLGIDDSSQIAEFLRYSVNTIYNYRAKVKNKACVARDDFEKLVEQIR